MKYQSAAIWSVSVMVRALVSLWDYSGKASPPMFGDYEAQRHWMEITVNLPINDWYRPCADNDLLYWGLDYPPLTAYTSFIFGSVARFLVPELVALRDSRGYESVETKLFMRMTVLIADAVLFMPVMFALSKQLVDREAAAIGSRQSVTASSSSSSLSPGQYFLYATTCLLAPGLLLIDHGHFQYNSVCLGFSLLALMLVSDDSRQQTLVLSTRDIVGSICFCLALNFKQMTLYYAPVFFVHLLRKALSGVSLYKGVGRVCQLGCTVILSFSVLWLPLCYSYSFDGYSSCAATLRQVLHRQFPFSRGIFEDKVANIWYALSVVADFRQVLDQTQLVLCSLALTLLLLLPTCICVFVHSSIDIEGLLLALMGSSLAFFLASFQVHEKSILLMLVAATPLLVIDPIYYCWVQLLGLFSMHPLLVRDLLRMPYWLCGAVHILLVLLLLDQRRGNAKSSEQRGGSLFVSSGLGRAVHYCFGSEQIKISFIALSCVGMLVLHAAEALLAAPSRYPDLYPALFSIYGAANLCIVYLKCIHDQWALLFASSRCRDPKRAQ